MNIIESKTYQKELAKIKQSSKKSTTKKILDRIDLFLECKISNKTLPPDFKDHALNNNNLYKNCRECHLRGDTLLIYRVENNAIELVLLRIGSHSQLFDSFEYVEQNNNTNWFDEPIQHDTLNDRIFDLKTSQPYPDVIEQIPARR